MSKDIRIKNGLSIKIKGAAENIVKKAVFPKSISLNPNDFHLITPKMVVKIGDNLKAGDVVFYSKDNQDMKFCSPVSGNVKDIVRGQKRKITEIIIDTDLLQKSKKFKTSKFEDFKREDIILSLLESGCWPFINQRPYDIIANPSDTPKSIFISTFNTAPISADIQIVLDDQKNEFITGIKVLKKLTNGSLNICVEKGNQTFINEIKDVVIHNVSGPHPAGNVGVQIHHIDPINSGEKVWTINPEDVAIIGRFFLTGNYTPLRTIAISGPPVKYPQYYKTIAGSKLSELINDAGVNDDLLRFINGDVLSGKTVDKDNYLGFYNNTFSVLREGNHYNMFGWIPFINNKVPSIYKTSFSWLFPNKKYDLDTNMNGEERAFVVTGEMEKVFPMDILPMQLLKECMIGDIEKMENLGIYEVAPEDFSLIDYSSSSKIEAQQIIRKGLDLMILEVG
ncbi:MAG: Na(+)-translocating NADH-quinone reductase subunit A [Bacteroidetes bacterium]|jgi:Na+-transporting NADH:ubiquinone oxidoreductase subunit A|nr:MAG: Na(+)-translocating NADH-quinone reductase subunit A [Cryomorphaceae bacterium BACL29 MAG-121220-bin8]MDA0758237.1 Na(+)-translocating NADH-quinone reductase subunit A [Bacteroidota bacterium]MDA1018681.1 Na(+)-translocating NADH-quinone reductase subunit A [Bacteroidota bacterium]|tara:strand:- start:10789 stop:12141 length:1353 start_codon:yes stop_codon:yes gene_type:complete